MKIWLDDALEEQYKYVFPLLKKLGLKEGIIIPVITGLVGKPATSPLTIPCMKIEQLKEMIDYGCKIASHTVTHPHLDEVSSDKLIWELIESKKWIIKNLNFVPTIFVAPYDKYLPRQELIIKSFYPTVRPMIHRSDIVIHRINDPRVKIVLEEEAKRREDNKT